MNAARFARWPSLAAQVVVAVLLFAVISLAYAAPTVAAAACPACYGMVPLGEGVFVDSATPEPTRRDIMKSMSVANDSVRDFFGTVSHRRVILVCGDEECETRLKSRLEGTARVRAFTYDLGGYPVLRISPRGLQPSIIAQELSHVELHERIGFLNHMRGLFPAWFDEGLAVLIAGDSRYFKPGRSAAERCYSTPDFALPATPIGWDEAAGRRPWIYAKATCEVMKWMETNGGKDGVIAAIARVGAGGPFAP